MRIPGNGDAKLYDNRNRHWGWETSANMRNRYRMETTVTNYVLQRLAILDRNICEFGMDIEKAVDRSCRDLHNYLQNPLLVGSMLENKRNLQFVLDIVKLHVADMYMYENDQLFAEMENLE